MWQELVGATPSYLVAGTAAATITVPNGIAIHQISVHATAGNGTVAIFGLPAITIIAGERVTLQFQHMLMKATAAANQIVITGASVDAYFIHGVREGNVT